MGDNKEYISQSEEIGSVNIAEDVIASIAAIAASEVDGVSGLSANIGADIAELLGKKSLSRGIKLQMNDGAVSIDVHIMIKYGYIIPEVAQNIQKAVSGAVESMTGLGAAAVNVHVSGIVFDKGK